MIQFAQQLSGAADIPLTRLFGQSPAGLSSTGESDMRNYYDMLKSQQKARLLRPVRLLYDLVHRTRYGEPLPDGFGVTFAPLWQLSETERAGIASQVTSAVGSALQDGVIDIPTAMKELRQSSRVTGIFSNITDEAIEAAVNAPPPIPEGMPGAEGQPPGPGAQTEPGAAPGSAQTEPGAAPAPPSTNAIAPEGVEPPTAPDASEAEDAVAADPRERVAQLAARHPRHAGTAPDGTPTKAAGAVEGATGSDIPAEGEEATGWQPPPPDGTWVEVLEDGNRWVHITKDGADNTYPMRNLHGFDVIIETPKGTARRGYGWATIMPCDYGYLSNTSSAEHPREQMDCFVGPDADSELVWVVDQLVLDLHTFDEHKIMLDFSSEADALAAYKAAFSDGRGAERIGNVRRMHVDVLKRWLAEEWPYGKGEPTHET
jgi:hypothetical protein